MPSECAEGEHACYILYNHDNRATYIGYSVNPSRRLRQHNCEIKGGAKATQAHVKRGVQWQQLCVITSPFFNKCTALSFEWHLKHPVCRGRRTQLPAVYRGADGRVRSVPLVLDHAKFAAAPHFTVMVCAEYMELARQVLASHPRVKLCELGQPQESVRASCSREPQTHVKKNDVVVVCETI